MRLAKFKLPQVFFLALIAGIILVKPVFAQEATQEATPTNTVLENASGTKPIHVEKIASLKTQYLAEVEAYRRSEQNFRVLKQQYLNLNTLKSLEDATVATKGAMYERSRVLTTHLEILYFTLLDTTGVNLTFKNAQVDALEDRVEEMRAHTAKIEQSSTRDEINELRDDFILIKPRLEDTSYRSMSLISMGRHQTVYDQSRIILKDLNEELLSATMSAIKKTELERAFFETDRSLNSVKANIDEINLEYAEQDKLVLRQFYQNVLKDLGTIYAQLSQNLSYLEELLRL